MEQVNKKIFISLDELGLKKYRIFVDEPTQYVLQRYNGMTVIKGTKDKKEDWASESFYGTLDQMVNKLIRLMTEQKIKSRTEKDIVMSFKDYVNEMNSNIEEVKNFIKGNEV